MKCVFYLNELNHASFLIALCLIQLNNTPTIHSTQPSFPFSFVPFPFVVSLITMEGSEA